MRPSRLILRILLGVLLGMLVSRVPARASPHRTEWQHKDRKDKDLPRLREVLSGVLYRSGAPTQAGLRRLCSEGFARIYSLYGARTTAKGERNEAMLKHGLDRVSCEDKDGPREIEWRSATSRKGRSLPAIFSDVQRAIADPAEGPVLIHCWNGLHYAGMVAAMALRQFCGFSAEAAEAYWWSTTSQGALYPHVIRRIHSFRALPGFALSERDRKRVCPGWPRPQDDRRVARRPESHLTSPAAN